MFKTGRLSLIRFVRDTMISIDRNNTIDFQYFDWDAHADAQDIPNADLVGINGFGMIENDGFDDVVFGITISTYNDPNVMRMTDIVDCFYDRLRGGKQWNVYAADGNVMGQATMIRGTTVIPVVRSETRNVFTVTGGAVLVPEIGG